MKLLTLISSTKIWC